MKKDELSFRCEKLALPSCEKIDDWMCDVVVGIQRINIPVGQMGEIKVDPRHDGVFGYYFSDILCDVDFVEVECNTGHY